MRSAIRYGLFLALLLPAGQATADPAACTSIADDAERLGCFDREFPRTVETSTAGPARWTASSKPSLLPDRTDRSVSVDSLAPIACRWSKPRPVRLTIACTRNVTLVSFETGCFMTSSQYRSYGDVSYSLDDAEARVAPMAAASDNRSLGLWTGEESIPFLRELLTGERLGVRMTPYADEPIAASFDIRGIAEAIAPVREECGW